MAPSVSFSPARAVSICAGQCKAACCRGPSYLRLTPEEVAPFAAGAARLHVPAVLAPQPDGSALIRFLEQPGECCPMLDPQTSRCRIYATRPARCRRFPESVRPGCALSAGVPQKSATSRR